MQGKTSPFMVRNHAFHVARMVFWRTSSSRLLEVTPMSTARPSVKTLGGVLNHREVISLSPGGNIIDKKYVTETE